MDAVNTGACIIGGEGIEMAVLVAAFEYKRLGVDIPLPLRLYKRRLGQYYGIIHPVVLRHHHTEFGGLIADIRIL